MTYLEIIAAVFGFLCVYFYIIRNVWAWPTGLVQVVLLIVVFYDARLYADMVLHVVYVGLQIYGWVAWIGASGSAGESIIVRSFATIGKVAAIGVIVAMTILFSFLLTQYTDASLPVVDSFIAATSLVAQYLLAKRYLENWMLWIVVDVVGIGLFAFKALYPTAILYALFLVMALIGLTSWSKLSVRPALAASKPMLL